MKGSPEITAAYPWMRQFSTSKFKVGFKMAAKGLQVWRLEPRLRSVRLRADPVRKTSNIPSDGNVSMARSLDQEKYLLVRPDPSRMTTSERIIPKTTAALSAGILTRASERSAPTPFSSKGASRPSSPTSSRQQNREVKVTRPAAVQNPVIVPGEAVLDLPVKGHEPASRNNIPTKSSYSTDDPIVSVGLPKDLYLNIPGTNDLPVQASDGTLISKLGENARLRTKPHQSDRWPGRPPTGARSGFAGEEYGIATTHGTAGSENAQDGSASMTQSGNVTGELWLDTLSLRDWLRAYLNDEMARAAGGGNLTAGIF